MKSVGKGNAAKKVIRDRVIRRELTYVAENLPGAVCEKERARTKAADRPEQDAAERMKDGAVDSAFALADISASAARAAYLRGKAVREKFLQAKNIQREGGKEKEPPMPSPAARRGAISTEAQRRDKVRRRLYAQKATSKQAEKEALRKAAGTAQPEPSPRLAHWRQDTKRQIFRRSAVWQKHAVSAKAGGRIHSVSLRPRLFTPRPYTFPAMRTRLQSAAGYTLGRLTVALAKAARAAVRSIAALIGAGGIVLLLVMVAGAAAAMIGSPMGILFADATGDPNAIPIASIVQETNAAFGQAINDIVTAHPECDEVDIQYHYEAGRTWQSYWPEVLAVFAVQANLGDDGNVIVIDAHNAQKIRDTFWMMHEITAEVETVEVGPDEEEAPVESSEADESVGNEETAPEPQYRHILHISVSGKTADEMTVAYAFTADQRDILHQLLSAEMRPMLAALCGGAMDGGIAAGALQWPLPGIYNITCQFGEPDAIRGLPHKGVDIAAPEGTPILAAHDGTVLISGWNDSYGNQVLLDNGTGLSTRYAHMIETAVGAGEAVTAGQIIGYVGSTGDSTGNHLHFEIMVNGVRGNPLLSFGI